MSRQARHWFYGGLTANVILVILCVIIIVPLSWTELVVLSNADIKLPDLLANSSICVNTTMLPAKYQLHLWGYTSLRVDDEVVSMTKVNKFMFDIPKLYSNSLSYTNETYIESLFPLSKVDLRDLAEASQNIRDLNLTILVISCLSFALQVCGIVFESSIVLAVIGAFVSILMSLIMTLLALVECLGAHLAIGVPIVKHFTSTANVTGIVASRSEMVYIPLGFMVPMGCLVGVLGFTGFTFNIGYARVMGK